MKKIAVILLLIFSFAQYGCKSFVEKNEIDSLKLLEKDVYTVLAEIVVDNDRIAKGDTVRVLLSMEKSWIKVYAYRANDDPLTAKRFIAIYLFEDDFPDKKFNTAFFVSKFNEHFTKIRAR